MKHQNQLFKIFALLVLFASSVCSTALFAQSESTKTMTITVVAVDEEGNQTTQTIIKEGDEVDENNIEAEIDALIAEMNQDHGQLEIDVNVEIEDNSDTGQGGNEMIEEERTITIDMSGDDTQMMIIDTENDELDAETRKKLEKALEGTDIDLDDLLNGNVNGEGPQRRMRIKKMHKDTPSNKAFLGVYVSADTTPGGRADTDGIYIDVVEDSAAEKAGLKNGDIIHTIDGKKVADFNSLVEVISNYEAGDVVKINYTRAGNSQTVEATLMGRKRHAMSSWKSKHGKQHNFKKGKFSSCDPNDPSTWPAGCCEGGNKPVGCCSKKANDKARLGVYLEEGDFDGAKVSGVIEGSDAEKAGIEEGAIIQKVGKTKIQNVDELIDAIQGYKIGDEAKIHWVNGSNKNKKKVTFTKAVRKSSGCCSGRNPQNNITEKKVIIRKKEIESRKEVIEEAEEDSSLPSFLNLNTIELFPNPTDGKITVKFTINNKEATKVELIDVAGKAIYSEFNTDFDGSYSNEIDLTGNPEGVYILSISQNDKTFTEKIIFNKN